MEQQGQASSIPQPLVVAPPPGDPLVLGLGSFIAGATIVGFFLTETLTTGFYFLPVTIGSSFLGLLIATLWAARLGQTFVAAVLGLFMSFWASLGILGFALVHGWFGDAAAATDALAGFYWTWGIVIALLTIAALRLPLLFVLLIGGVALTLIILALGTSDAGTGLEKLAGYVLWASDLVGVILFLGAGSVSLGGKGMSAGPVLLK